MILLSTQSFPHYSLERVFEFTKEAGFDGVEIVVSKNLDTQDPEYIKRLSERYGIPVRAFSIDVKNVETLTKAFQLTAREFPGATLNLPPAQNFAFTYKKWLKAIVPKLAQKYNLNFNLKNVEVETMFGVLPKSSQNSVAALKESGYVCLDLSALWSSKEEVMRAVQFLGGNLRHVYLSNVHANVPYSGITKGVIPVESLLNKLALNKFKGDFTLVLGHKQLHEGEKEKMFAELKLSKDFYDQYFTKVAGQLENPAPETPVTPAQEAPAVEVSQPQVAATPDFSA